MKTNRELVKIFEEMALMLELEEVEWKPRAYRNAAQAIDDLKEDIEELYKEKGRKGLEEIPGVGKHIADHIIEYIETGKIKSFGELRKKYPGEITELMKIEGIGPKTIRRLIDELGIDSVEKLRKAAKTHKIRDIKGFGEKTEEDILEGLKVHKEGKERMLITKALPIAREISEFLKKNSPAERIDCVGSIRRMKETIGDIDILVASKNPGKVMEAFVGMDKVKKVLSEGPTRSSIVLKEDDIGVDLRVIEKPVYGAALIYFTGSKAHNIALRKIAIDKGYKLSEYGLFRKNSDKTEPYPTEEKLYKKLGLRYIPPEIREDRGEIEAVRKGTLPKLVELGDIKGDFHVHTKYSDGVESVEEMVRAAQDLGYEYVAITDHSKSEMVARGMNEKRIKEQWKEIDKVQDKFKIKILKGSEVDILKDGELDYPKEILKELDIVIGSIHSGFAMAEDKITKRIISALENEYLDILGHPVGRKIGERRGIDADFRKIFEAAAKNGKFLEINCLPIRLDLNEDYIFLAREMKAKFCLGTDSHSGLMLDNMKYGLGQARKGWLERRDILNTKGYRAVKKILGF